MAKLGAVFFISGLSCGYAVRQLRRKDGTKVLLGEGELEEAHEADSVRGGSLNVSRRGVDRNRLENQQGTGVTPGSGLIPGGPWRSTTRDPDAWRPTRGPSPSPGPSWPGAVFTIGDSYSSGTGIHKDGADYDEEHGGRVTYLGRTYTFAPGGGDCWREKDTTPGPKWGASSGKQAFVLACKGAEVKQIERQFEYLLVRYPETYRGNFENSVIVLTAGGNDLRNDAGDSWPDIVRRCLMSPGQVFGGCHSNPDNTPTNFKEIEDNLSELYKKIGRELVQADPQQMPRVRVLGYPRLMNPFGGSCPGVGMMSADEANWADRQVNRLNQRIEDAAARARAYFRETYSRYIDIQYVDVTGYITKCACTREEDGRQINDVKSGDGGLVSSASFHPNQGGYNGFFQALRDSLQ